MAIPLRVLSTLRISLAEKFSIALVFTVGIVTMVCAIVRCVSLNSSVKGGQVSTTWLILWAAIEGVVCTYPAVPRRLSLSPLPSLPAPSQNAPKHERGAT